MPYSYKIAVCKCKLEDGSVHKYDLASQDYLPCDSSYVYGKTYLGKGVILSVDGKPYGSDKVFHFWKINKNY